MAIWNPHGLALSTVPELELNTGNKIPMIGLATSISATDDVDKVVEEAIDAGYRFIDCAAVNGNEENIGEVVKKKMAQGVVTREEMFIASKLPVYSNDPNEVREAAKASLRNLKVKYLDMYMIHFPVSIDKQQYKNLGAEKKSANPSEYFKNMDESLVWKEMEKLVDEGFTKNIALCNFNAAQVQKILANCRIKPSLLQVGCHAYLPQQELFDLCRKNDIVMCAYAPLGSCEGSGERSHQALLQEPVLGKIAEKYGKTPAQVLLRWLIQRDIVVITKSIRKDRINQNFHIWDFCLNEHEVDEINSLAKDDGRLFTFDEWKDSPNYPF